MKFHQLITLKQLIVEKKYYDFLNTVSCHNSNEELTTIATFDWYLGLAYFFIGDENTANEIWMNKILENHDLIIDFIKSLDEVANIYLDKNQLIHAKKIINILSDSLVLAQELRDEVVHVKVFDRYGKLIDKMILEASSLALLEKFLESQEIYEKILAIEPENVYAWHNLGMVFFEQEKLDFAYEAVVNSLKINDLIARHHYSLGLILEKLGNFELAKKAYQEAINLDRALIDAYNNLGQLEKKCGNFSVAHSLFEQIIKLKPDYYGAYINLGNLCVSENLYQQAIKYYEVALALRSNDPNILYNIAIAYEKLGDKINAKKNYGLSALNSSNYETAVEHFHACLNLVNEKKQQDVNIKSEPDIYFYLGSILMILGYQKEAINILNSSINEFPEFEKSYRFLFYNYQQNGELEEAKKVIELALQKCQNKLSFKFLECSLLPIVYQNQEDIKKSRKIYLDSFNKLISSTINQAKYDKNDLINSINLRTNFYLSYQSYNDLFFLKSYGNWVCKIMELNYPQYCKSIPMHAINNKIKIGYISCRFQQKLGFLFKEWIMKADKSLFEIYCYDLHTSVNIIHPEIKVFSEHYYHFPNQDIDQIVSQIHSDKLHILIFFDIGLDSIITLLASLTLAPIQCTTWAHPITSGLKTIHYFLTSEAMESPNAKHHYCEELIYLPKLGLIYPEPQFSSEFRLQSRSYFELDEQCTLMTLCQNIAKYLPQYDYIFPELVLKLANHSIKFLFLSGDTQPDLLAKFETRLNQCFTQYGLRSSDYFYFLPKLTFDGYLNVLNFSDIFLDTFDWSGGITSIDAISQGLPIVTRPGQFLRGRQSAGMLKILGITETIAEDEQDYIDITVKLVTDQHWRNHIKHKILANKHLIFNDYSPIQSLESFYQTAIQSSTT